ncbi:MAG: EF-hand domain-containing protein [Pseudomonadota bacterium]
MKRVLGITLLVSAFAVPAFAGEVEDQFFSMDRNRDGQISREEFVNSQTAAGKSDRQANFAFDNFRGSDERITLTEFRGGPLASLKSNDPIQRAVRQPVRRSASSGRNSQRSAPPPPRSTGGFGS